MRNSLRNQFRGVLIGAALGDILGLHCQTRLQAKLPLSWLNIDQWGWAAIDVPSIELSELKQVSETKLSLTWGSVVVEGVHQLIQNHRWEPANLPIPVSDLEGITTAIATLPLILYFHDDLDQLRQQTQRLLAVYYPSGTAEVANLMLIPTYAIALILQQRTQINCLIPTLIHELNLRENHPLAAQQLTTLQSQLEEGIGLERVLQEYAPIPSALPETLLNLVTIVLYSTLNTPEHFRLSLLQAAHCKYYSPFVCSLVGALSGAYRGLSDLPFAWQRALNYPGNPYSVALSRWRVASVSELIELADDLLASWAGVYNPVSSSTLGQFPVSAPNHRRP